MRHQSRDSSVGRAADCSGSYANIRRSLVRFRFAREGWLSEDSGFESRAGFTRPVGPTVRRLTTAPFFLFLHFDSPVMRMHYFQFTSNHKFVWVPLQQFKQSLSCTDSASLCKFPYNCSCLQELKHHSFPSTCTMPLYTSSSLAWTYLLSLDLDRYSGANSLQRHIINHLA